ncbi:MAG: lipopolysaccharide assembly protein LapA domain-containing protein [Candidatus Methylomirabilota bacterium]
MGQLALILSLALAILVAVFAVQNSVPVTLRFGFWSVETSLVVVILVAVAAGAAVASLLGLPGWIRDRHRLKLLTRELDGLRAAQVTASREASDSPESTLRPPA